MGEVKLVPAAPGNWRPGRTGHTPAAIVIHLMDGSLASCDNWFKNSAAKVSAHYGIGRAGEVHQYVHESDTAYHAGNVVKPSWRLIRPGLNPNLYTIGIEHEGRPDDVWTDAQMRASAEVIAGIAKRWGIPLDRDHLPGHHEIYAPKICPGPHADIDALISMAVQINAGS